MLDSILGAVPGTNGSAAASFKPDYNAVRWHTWTVARGGVPCTNALACCSAAAVHATTSPAPRVPPFRHCRDLPCMGVTCHACVSLHCTPAGAQRERGWAGSF